MKRPLTIYKEVCQQEVEREVRKQLYIYLRKGVRTHHEITKLIDELVSEAKSNKAFDGRTKEIKIYNGLMACVRYMDQSEYNEPCEFDEKEFDRDYADNLLNVI